MAACMKRPARLKLLGSEVDVVTPTEMLAFTEASALARRQVVIANHNAHSLHLVRGHREMASLYARADLIEIDSVPLIFWGRLLGEAVRRRHRCNYLDFRDQLWSLTEREGWRVFHLGGAPGVGQAARTAILERHPGVKLDVSHGFFDIDGAQNAQVLAQIRAFDPHILLVGMGMPRQEVWIARNLSELPAAVIFTLGAAFDYEAGVIATPPRFMARLGLEWLARLIDEPGRLAHRYLVEPWRLAPLAFDDVRQRLWDRRRAALATREAAQGQ